MWGIMLRDKSAHTSYLSVDKKSLLWRTFILNAKVYVVCGLTNLYFGEELQTWVLNYGSHLFAKMYGNISDMAEKGSLLPNNNDNNYHKKEGSCEESLFVRRHSDTDGCDGEASPIYRILGFLGRVITTCSPPSFVTNIPQP